MKMYDISVPIRPSIMVWPGDPAVVLNPLSAISTGEHANVTEIKMSAHTGTHIDAPKHFIDNGKAVDQIPLWKLIGRTLVMEIDEDIDGITDLVLATHPAKDLLFTVTKVLFKTRNSGLWRTSPSTFQADYVGIDASGAEFLAQLDLDLIGVDYLSVAPYEATSEPHLAFLSKEIVLLEGINLEQVQGGIYDLFCLPLNIEGCDGAPARAVLIERDRSF